MLPTECVSAIYGLCGAIISDIVQDNKLVMPKRIDGELVRGFIAGAALGAAAVYFIDVDPTRAFLAGYSGKTFIQNIIAGKSDKESQQQESIEEIIRRVAKEEGIDAELAVRVAKAESNLNPKAVNVNTTGSTDRGLYQINTQYHPEVTDAQAFNPEFSARFFAQAFKNGHLDWWNTTRSVWEK